MSVKYYAPKQGAFFVLCASILFLVATPVEAFKEHKRDILMLKIALGISCTTAGGVLLWQHRPSRIDDTLSALEKNQEKLVEAKETLEKQANEVVNTKINEFNQILVVQQEENLRLKEQLAEAHYPKLPPETTPANCHCRAVQLALWREGIIFDWDKHDPPAYVRAQKGRNYQQYVFEPRNQTHLMKFIKAKSEVPSLCEYALGNEGAVNVSQQGNRVIIRYYPGEMTTTEKAEIELAKKARELAKLPTLQQLASYRVGFFIAGGSGAGKTSTCLLVAEAIQNIELNKEDYARFKKPEILEAIALDTHAHDPSNARGWDLLGVKAVWEPMAVLEQLDYLEEEFRARKAGRKGNRILVLFDEYGETYKDMRTLLLADEDNSEAYIKRTLIRKSDFIVSLATGGSRKFGIIPVIMNQTWNCTKLKMDASERNNFIGIYLNKLADTYALNAKITDKEILEALAENKDNYRALVSGACPDSFMVHPAFPGKPLTLRGVPPEYTPEVELHEPSIKLVDWGVREPGNGKVTGESRHSHGEVTEEFRVTRSLPQGHGLEPLLALDCEDCHPWELLGLTVEYGGESIVVSRETIELVAKLKQEGLTKKTIMKEVWGKAWNGDEKSKRISHLYNKIINYLGY